MTETAVQTIPIVINEQQRVDARQLHAFLESKRHFANWIRERIETFGFVEGTDFIVNKFVNEENQVVTVDYFLTVSMAKELSMVERNEKGKQARQYFIEVEKRFFRAKDALGIGKPQTALDLIKTQLAVLSEIATQMVEQERRVTNVETKVEQIAGQVTPTAIRAMVKGALKDEVINVFPRGCTSVEKIGDEYFPGISKAKVAAYLRCIKHPQRFYKHQTEDNVVRTIGVFVKDGLESAAQRFFHESSLVTVTKKNRVMNHPIIGNYFVKRGSPGDEDSYLIEFPSKSTKPVDPESKEIPE